MKKSLESCGEESSKKETTQKEGRCSMDKIRIWSNVDGAKMLEYDGASVRVSDIIKVYARVSKKSSGILLHNCPIVEFDIPYEQLQYLLEKATFPNPETPIA
ncbi:MAG: hypothetical protein NTU76_02235 [Candidatus Taylorbacteria bacterium]|nr:hypothetical protein [Candidatus Taylorbacteria bacterium]